ncbi:hypothetical protein [Arenimonas oryziterrae]|uniref:Uncharacterized protein n=1 Tax=Arenimonas oryziterrae DSM 21050 = YC6267 TaxID=1121015 RepID=A0A091B019_9GAMM|nr:hypothetical protein [Arenimonas oryziterrae]KFN45026.1 hypothetical protein N789_03115 [Arenimonas oryziterrae DSM 21050 = YC6267]
MNRTLAALGLFFALAAGPVLAEAPPRFPPGNVWNKDITYAPLHPQSTAMINAWVGLGGFGNGRMQIDFAMRIVRAPGGAPTRTIVAYPDASEYYFPDCEAAGTAMPVPANAMIEGSTNLTCDNAGEDCHLLVVQGNRLYEAYRANGSGATGLQAQCLAIWKLDRVYPDNNRGEHCTSADAAGFPIAPLLFNADEVYAAMQNINGDLGHAIRFILPNPRMASTVIDGDRYGYYVHPGSHAGGPTGPESTVPYGSRLRLRANFPVNSYPPAAQVILRTMQRYGIVLADGGNIALTAEDDVYTTHKWAEIGISSRVFDQAVPASPVRAQDFAIIDTGARIVETWDCVRNIEPTAPNRLVGTVTRQAGLPRLPQIVGLTWQDGAAQVDVYRNGVLRATLANTHVWSDKAFAFNENSASYLVCNAGTAVCSNAAVPAPTRTNDPPPPRPPSVY